MLELHKLVGLEIRDVCPAHGSGILLDQHPQQVRPEQSLLCAIWILNTQNIDVEFLQERHCGQAKMCVYVVRNYLFGVSIAMVGTVVAAPPADGALHGTGRGNHENELEGGSSGICSMGPETMVS